MFELKHIDIEEVQYVNKTKGTSDHANLVSLPDA
jgi:hypothetical protein